MVVRTVQRLSLLALLLGREPRRLARLRRLEQLLLAVDAVLEVLARLGALLREADHPEQIILQTGHDRFGRVEARRLSRLLHRAAHVHLKRLALWHVRHLCDAGARPLTVDANLARAALALAALVLDVLPALRRDLRERLADDRLCLQRLVALREADGDVTDEADRRRAFIGRAALNLSERLRVRKE